jgi:hypothetical protein
MQHVLRPYVTAGVALVGAGTIAVTPLAPPLPHVQVPSIRLASASDFLGDVGQEFGDAVTGVFGNVGIGDVNPLDGLASLGAAMLQDPGAQGLSGIVGDYAHLFTSFVQVATTIDGHWVLQEPVEILDTILGNGIIPSFSNIADLPGYLVNDVFPALVQSGFGSIDNTLMQLGNIGSDLGAALTNEDPSGFFGTLAAAPAELVNALLFEHGGSNAFDGFLVPFTSLTDTGFDALLKQLPELIVNELFLGPGGGASGAGVTTVLPELSLAGLGAFTPLLDGLPILNTLPDLPSMLTSDLASMLTTNLGSILTSDLAPMLTSNLASTLAVDLMSTLVPNIASALLAF